MYKSKYSQYAGSSLGEVIRLARREYHVIQKRTPRRVPYIRSKYFTKDKIFINNFWDHLNQKGPKEKVVRLKLYPSALDLIRNSPLSPVSFQNPDNSDEVLHRFYGISKDGQKFAVQVKDNKKTGRKDFLSVFPVKKTK
jgi:hypothetical protein